MIEQTKKGTMELTESDNQYLGQFYRGNTEATAKRYRKNNEKW